MEIDARTEALARFLCGHHDPDLMVYSGVPMAVEYGVFACAGTPKPYWNLKVNEALATLEFLNEQDTTSSVQLTV